MLKYIKFGLIFTFLFLSCKHIEQYRSTIDEHHVEIREFTDQFGIRFAFQPVCVGTLTNRSIDFIYSYWIGVVFHPHIEGATDHRIYQALFTGDTLWPDESMEFLIKGGKKYCLPDYEIPNITVISIRTKFRYAGGGHGGD